MKKLFISQPMRGKTEEQIKAEREEAILRAREETGEDFEILDTYFGNFDGKARGCIIEHECAVAYNVPHSEAET